MWASIVICEFVGRNGCGACVPNPSTPEKGRRFCAGQILSSCGVDSAKSCANETGHRSHRVGRMGLLLL